MTALEPEMLRRARSREPQALAVFFEHYIDRAYGYARHLVGDAMLADDLIQEAFLRMHQAIDRLDPERDPTPWVFTVLTNCARDHWRSRVHRMTQRQVDLEEAWNLSADDLRSNPEGALVRNQTGDAVRAALERLSAADREILLLKEFEQLSTAEIAAVLEKSPDAIRQRHSRAVRRLARVYKEIAKKESKTK